VQRKQGRISLVGRLREFWIGRADLAPVALFRIVYGIELFNWFWQLIPNIPAFFTDEGFMPRGLLVSMFPDRFSLITGMGTWWQVGIFLAGLLLVKPVGQGEVELAGRFSPTAARWVARIASEAKPGD